MKRTINYSITPPDDFRQLLTLYESLGWNSLNLSVDDLEKMCIGSWYAVYAYDREQLIGMGRIISEGVITGIICGVCVLPTYQSMGIGKQIVSRLIAHCEQNSVIPQLMCLENLEAYYEGFGFKTFSIGMTKNIQR